MRAFWKGTLYFQLVEIPVKLYAATKDASVQFNLLHGICNTRIKNVHYCESCAEIADYSELVKGFEVSKGVYAPFSKEELKNLEEQSEGGGIEIMEFCPAEQVDSIYIDKSYWIGPDSKGAPRSYTVLLNAISQSNKIGIGKVKLRTKTRLCAVRYRDGRLALDTLKRAEEIVSASELVLAPAKVSDRETELASKLINQLSVDFNPSKHVDEYKKAVISAAEQKMNSISAPAASSIEEKPSLIDLEDLLRKSLSSD